MIRGNRLGRDSRFLLASKRASELRQTPKPDNFYKQYAGIVRARNEPFHATGANVANEQGVCVQASRLYRVRSAPWFRSPGFIESEPGTEISDRSIPGCARFSAPAILWATISAGRGRTRLGAGIEFQRLDFLKDRLESLFQLLLRPRFAALGPDKLTVVSDGAAIIVGCLAQQLDLFNVCHSHHSILRWLHLTLKHIAA